jgi:hypothetical protein
MREIELLVEAYLTAERGLIAAVDSIGGAVPLPTRARSPSVASSSTRCSASVASGRG